MFGEIEKWLLMKISVCVMANGFFIEFIHWITQDCQVVFLFLSILNNALKSLK